MEITATRSVLLLFITLMEALGNYEFCLITPASSPWCGYSDPCWRVIKPPLREAGNPIHHGGNEMKMNSVSFPSNKGGAWQSCRRLCRLREVSRSGGWVEFMSFMKLLCFDNTRAQIRISEDIHALSGSADLHEQLICDCSFSFENISSTCDLRQLLQFPFPPPAVHHWAGLIITRT